MNLAKMLKFNHLHILLTQNEHIMIWVMLKAPIDGLLEIMNEIFKNNSKKLK
jgi:hypothetical protein